MNITKNVNGVGYFNHQPVYQNLPSTFWSLDSGTSWGSTVLSSEILPKNPEGGNDPMKTVDGSEIPRPTTWDGAKTL